MHGVVVGLLAAWALTACGPDNEEPPAPPTIVVAPADAQVSEGDAVTFTAKASGQGPLQYQWHRDGAPIAGAEQTTLRVADARPADDGARFFVTVKNAGGSVASTAAVLRVERRALAPTIETGPAALQVMSGQTARFSVTASGTGPLAYQWQRNGVDVEGAQASVIELVAQLADDGALYGVRITNPAGEVRSGSARLSVVPAPVAPSITQAPVSVRVTEGQRAVFTAQASGTAPLAWQWLRDGQPIPDANAARYEIDPTLADQGAHFSVRVSNAAGQAVSAAATLSVERAMRLELIAGTVGGVGNLDGSGTAARLGRSVVGAVVDAAGNVFFADFEASVIRKVAPGGTVSTVAGIKDSSGVEDGDVSSARLTRPRGLALDLNGDLIVADSSLTVRRVSGAGLVTTIAGKAYNGGTADGIGANARFGLPNGVVVTNQGRIIVADTSGHTLREISPTGQVTTLAGLAGAAGTADGDGAAARFTSPAALTCAQPPTTPISGCQGAVLVVDAGRVVRKVGIDNTLAGLARGRVLTVAGSPTRSHSADGPVASVGFGPIQGIIARSAARFVVAEDMTLREVNLDPAAGRVSTLVGQWGVLSWADGPVAGAGVGYLHAPLLGVDGSLLFFDSTNTSLRKLSPAGVLSTVVGVAADWVSRDGLGAAARFGQGHGALARDAAGNVYVADGCAIRRIRSDGQVATYAGVARQCAAVDGSTTAARFWDIRALAFDAGGALYVADAANSAVRRIAPSGQVTTVVGALGQRGNVQGDASLARLSSPTALAFESDGSLLVADGGNHNIVRVSTSRQVTLVAGSGTRGALDGPGPAAQFDTPAALAAAGGGATWVWDYNGLRRIAATGTVSTLAPAIATYADGPLNHASVEFPGALVTTALGDLYLSQPSAGTLRRLRADGVLETVVGRAHERGTRPGDGASAAQPTGLALDPVTRQIYVREPGGVLRVTLP